MGGARSNKCSPTQTGAELLNPYQNFSPLLLSDTYLERSPYSSQWTPERSSHCLAGTPRIGSTVFANQNLKQIRVSLRTIIRIIKKKTTTTRCGRRAHLSLFTCYWARGRAAQHQLGTNTSHRPPAPSSASSAQPPVPARGGRRPAGGTPRAERSAAPRPAPAPAPAVPSAQRAAAIRAAGREARPRGAFRLLAVPPGLLIY